MKRPLLQLIVAWEPLLVAIAALTTMISPRLLPVALALAVLSVGARWAATDHPFQRTPADWAVALIVVLIPIGWWAAVDAKSAAPYAVRLLFGVLLFYSIAGAAAEGRGLLIGAGLTAAGAGLAIAAPFVIGSAGRVNANVLAGALLLPLAFPLAFMLFGWRNMATPARFLAVSAAAVMLVALIIARSRGALVGLAALLLVLVACRWKRGWLLSVLALAVAVATALAMGAGPFLGVGLETRSEIASRALRMLQEFPLTGIGLGGFEQATDLLYPLFLVGSQTDLPHAHNLYLQVGLDLGLAGLIGWLAIYLLTICESYLLWRRAGATDNAMWMALGAALLGGQVAVGVHGLLDAVMWGTGPSLLLWAAWGMALGSWGGWDDGAGRTVRPAPDRVS